jgi:hypothetical protein
VTVQPSPPSPDLRCDSYLVFHASEALKATTFPLLLLLLSVV